ncbi:hypothetical protein OHQ88_34320 (plasmid) [Micromonospora zamorensis]|uniref:hypothetical protein n=1 Tax=Micromonospora zamorensis TaxID=709883 RepID=UPI002E1DA5DE
MTYGYWIQRAHGDLERAHREIRTGAASSSADALAVLVVRDRVYRQLIRLSEMLLDLPRGDYTVLPAVATAALADGKATIAARMLQGLRAAISAPHSLPGTAGTPGSRAGRHLAAAAEKLATAGDVLASHAPPGRAPLTPEGEAIRIGAGVRAALGDIGQLLNTQLLTDLATPPWIGAIGSPTGRWERLLAPVRWAADSRLPAVATELVEHGVGQPALLAALPPAGAPRPPAMSPILDAHDAADRVIALCDWLYRHPDQVRVSHLRAGTHLGGVLCASVPSPSSRLRPAWTEAAITARNLDGSPTESTAQHIVQEMRQLTAWLRERPRRDGSPPTGVARAGLQRAASMLPLFASLLRDGARSAVRRGDIFTVSGQLARRPGELVWYAGGPLQVATAESRPVIALGLALTRAGEAGAPRGLSTGSHLARRGFLPLVARAGHLTPAGQVGGAPGRAPSRRR